MPNTIHKELDPFFETVGLLLTGRRLDEIRCESQKALGELGLDGEKFYKQHMGIFDRYVQTFLKHRALDREDVPFFDENNSEDFLLILLTLLVENRHLLASMDDFQDKEINAEILNVCKILFKINTPIEAVSTLDDIVLFLDGTSLAENAKWKVMRIMQNPKPQLKKLIRIINSNLDAFKKAESEIKKPLAKLLKQYQTSLNSKNAGLFLKLKNSLSQTADIYPTLVFPLSQMMFENSCYYGVLSNRILKGEENPSLPKEALLLKLKALSDNSKLEILCSLKISPKYNLEIAEQLGLTAATMSHHMNVLLTCGFVGVEKRDGRVYYHLQQDAIRQFLEALEQTLL